MADDLLDQRADRAACCCRSPGAGWPRATARRPGSTSAGVLLASTGLFGVVLGMVRANALGWTSAYVLTALIGRRDAGRGVRPLGAADRRSRCCRCGCSGRAVLGRQRGQRADVLRDVRRDLPALAGAADDAGLHARSAPACGCCRGPAMPIVVAPIAGILADRIGARPVVFVGLALQAIGLAWLAEIMTPEHAVRRTSCRRSWSAASAWRCSSHRPRRSCSARCGASEEGIASGAANALREIGGVFGVAVLASVFAAHGGYATPQTVRAGPAAGGRGRRRRGRAGRAGPAAGAAPPGGAGRGRRAGRARRLDARSWPRSALSAASGRIGCARRPASMS